MLADSKFDSTTPALRDNILQFYSGASASAPTRNDPARSAHVLASLDQLRTAAAAAGTEATSAR
jgi:hypothetical protein